MSGLPDESPGDGGDGGDGCTLSVYQMPLSCTFKNGRDGEFYVVCVPPQ